MRRTFSRSTLRPSPTAWRSSSTRCARSTRGRHCRTSGVFRKTQRLRAPEHGADHVLRVVAEGEQIHVFGADLPFREQVLADPVDEPAPVVLADEHNREVSDLVRLAERERLEHLVERPESAGENHEADRVAHEEELAREEVVAGEL